MNQQEIEVAIKVIEERLRIQDNHLKDVDECCGKLKGSSSQEFRMLAERITAIEHSVDDNCKDVEIELSGVGERVKTQSGIINDLKEEVNGIHKTYRHVTVEFILAVFIGIIALFIHF